MNWDDLRVFAEVARCGNLTAAATELCVSVSTAHRRIVSLESALGTRLFVRKKTGHELTAAGRALTERTAVIESAIHDVQHSIAGQDVELTGAVRVTTTQTAADYILLPAAPRLRERYPGIRLELEALPNVVSLVDEEPSIALRFLRPRRGDVSIRKLRDLRCSLYASRSLAGDASVSPRQLPFVGWSRQFRGIALARWLSRFYGTRPPAITVGSMQAQLGAACDGLGVANLPSFIAEKEDLVDLLPDSKTLALEAWLVVPRAIRHIARVAVVADFIAETVAEIG